MFLNIKTYLEPVVSAKKYITIILKSLADSCGPDIINR